MEPPSDSKESSQPAATTIPARALFGNILHGSSVYALALAAPLAAAVLLSPITTRCLSQRDFGVTELLTNVAAILSCLLSVNLSSAMGYFYFGATDAAGRRAAAGTAILGCAILGAGAAVICWPAAPAISHAFFRGVDAAHYLRVMFLLMFPAFIVDSLFVWLRVENRTRVFVAGSLLRVSMTVIGTLLFVKALGLGVWGVLATTGGAIVLTLVYVLAVWLRSMKPVLDTRLFTSMARFSLPLTGSSMAMFFLHFGDRLFLPLYWPLSDLAVYAIAYKIGMVMSTAYGAFHVYWGAQVFPIMRRADSVDVFRRVFTYVVLLVSAAALGLIVISGPAVHIMYRREYWGAANLVPVLVLAYSFRAIGDFIRCLFLVEGHPGYEAVCTFLGAAICLGGYLALIPKYGIWGAATATAIAFCVICAISLIWAMRVRPYPVDSPRLIKIAMAIGAAMIPYWLWRTAAFPVMTASAVLSLVVFVSVLLLLRFPTPGEWELVRSVGGAMLLRFGPAARRAKRSLEATPGVDPQC